jgi:L-lactate dehydrogenase
MPNIGVVGAGHVGVSCARGLARDGLVTRLTIYDRTAAHAEGEALDLAQAGPLLEPCELRGRGLDALEPEDVLIVTTGAHAEPGQTRLDLLPANLAVLEEVATAAERDALPKVCLVVSNPLDVLTEYLTRRWEDQPVNVMGSGTSLDTWRLAQELAAVCGVHPDAVHAWVVGEHGDSSVVLFSSATVAGMSLADFARQTGVDLSASRLAAIADDVRTAAYRVRQLKGATWHAIGLTVNELVRIMVREPGRVVPVSVRVADGVCASLPCVLGPDGPGPPLRPPVDDGELAAWEHSLAVLREALAVLP